MGESSASSLVARDSTWATRTTAAAARTPATSQKAVAWRWMDRLGSRLSSRWVDHGDGLAARQALELVEEGRHVVGAVLEADHDRVVAREGIAPERASAGLRWTQPDPGEVRRELARARPRCRRPVASPSGRTRRCRPAPACCAGLSAPSSSAAGLKSPTRRRPRCPDSRRPRRTPRLLGPIRVEGPSLEDLQPVDVPPDAPVVVADRRFASADEPHRCRHRRRRRHVGERHHILRREDGECLGRSCSG